MVAAVHADDRQLRRRDLPYSRHAVADLRSVDHHVDEPVLPLELQGGA
jgi:hypothetical protein